MVATQASISLDLRKKAEELLHSIRENCQKWAVHEDIKKLREICAQGGITLEELGTSEAELQLCLKTGFRSSAISWLKVARENSTCQDVSVEISHVRSRLAEGNLKPEDIGTSEEELRSLLAAHLPKKGWFSRLFQRNGRSC